MSESTSESRAEWTSDHAASSGERPPRSRVGAIALSAALIAGLGGFMLGHAVSRTSRPNNAATAGSEPATTIASEDPSTSAAPPTTADATAAGSATTDASTSDTTSAAATIPNGGETSATTVVGAVDGFVSAGGPGSQYTQNAYPEPAQTLIAERTTSTGIVLRAHQQTDIANGVPYPTAPNYGIPGWTPAEWCFPVAQLRISIATDAAVNVSWVPWYSAPRDGLSISTFDAGYIEGKPVFGLAAQVTSDVTSVTFTTASGLTDTASPVANGASALALLAVTGPIEQSFTVAVTKSDGSSTSLASSDLQTASTAEYHASCDPPPPALPPAGEQPADPEAAEAAVRESWRIVHDYDNSSTDKTVRIGRVDDPTGVQAAWTAIANGQYGAVAEAATTPIKELVFTSPTEAWIRYDVLNSITNFYDRYGQVELGTDGVWRITRQTICGDISLAAVQCEPGVDQLLPPSAANDPRYGEGASAVAVTTTVPGS